MKKMKNAMLVIAGGLLMLTIVTASCSKSSSGGSTTTPAPTISGVTSGATDTVGKSSTLTLTGANLTGATVTTSVAGVTVTGVTVTATSITGTIAVAAGTATGSVTITVTTAAGSATTTVTVVAAGLANVGPYSSSDQVYPTNLIAHWRFDNVVTEDISGAPPTLSSGSSSYTYVPGRIGTAIQLNDGWLTYPASFGASTDNTGNGSNDTLRNGFTLTMWTKQLPDTSTLSTLFQLSSPNIPNWPLLGIQYRKHADSTVDFDGGFSNVDASGPTVSYASLFTASAFKDTATWAFIAMTFDTTTHNVFYYYNGSLVATWPVASFFVSNSDEPLQVIAPNYATFGADESETTTPGDVTNASAGYMALGINATIDDVRFFNATLPAQILSDLYQLGNQGR